MRLIDSIRTEWREHGQFQRRYASLTLDAAGLMLGAGTVLAKRVSGTLDIDDAQSQARILALLTAAYGPAIELGVLGHIERAVKAEREDKRVLAAIHLAHAGLPPIGEDSDACHRLFFFEALIDEGTAPATILSALRSVDDLFERRNPYHDEHGRFATGNGAASGAIPAAYKPGKQKPTAKPAKPKPQPKTKSDYTAWKTRPNADFREKLAEKESTANQPNNGYGVKAQNGALGRYQMLPGALIDAGWKNSDGTWTEKAQEAGVKSDDDFLKNPAAQEQALTDTLEAFHKELKTSGTLDYVGKTITDSAGNQLTVTEPGLWRQRISRDRRQSIDISMLRAMALLDRPLLPGRDRAGKISKVACVMRKTSPTILMRMPGKQTRARQVPMLPKRNKALFVFGLLVAGMLSATCASNAFESGHGVPFRHLDNREVTAFAKKLFDETYRGEIAEVKAWPKDEEQRNRLHWLLRDGFPFGTLYADIDVNDDGVAERFVQFSDPYGCGSVGCLTFIYRRVPKGFELICTTYLGGDLMKQGEVVETGEILAATEDGYHLIDTGDGVTHWNMKDKPGNQCSTISYKG